MSGGPDSLALLLALKRVRGDLVVAHFDHGLRTESGDDARFVRSIAETLGCEFTGGRGDVRSLAISERRSIEEAARLARYRFLGEAAAACGAATVWLGHTADDQAESVLMHIIRGSGLQGLRGMAVAGEWPFGEGPAVQRPLLGVRRPVTAEYCTARGFEPLSDPMNLDRRYTRTRVRLDVIPLLESINPRVVEALGRLAAAARDTGRAAELVGSLRGAGVSQPTAALVEALSGLDAAPAGRRITMGRGIEATSTPGGTHIGAPIAGVAGGPAISIEPDTTAAWGDWTVALDAATEGGWTAVLRPGGVTVRTWMPGDRMAIGRGASKKLQDLFVDARVPRYDRGGWPVVCLDGEIAWVPGVRVAWGVDGRGRADALRVAVTRVTADAGTVEDARVRPPV